MLEHDALRTQLENRLTRLLRRVERIEGDLRQTHDPDWQERATELENDEVLEGLDEMTCAPQKLKPRLFQAGSDDAGRRDACEQRRDERLISDVQSELLCGMERPEV